MGWSVTDSKQFIQQVMNFVVELAQYKVEILDTVKRCGQRKLRTIQQSNRKTWDSGYLHIIYTPASSRRRRRKSRF